MTSLRPEVGAGPASRSTKTVISFLAGYQAAQTGSSSATTTFTVPKVTCSSTMSGIMPGAFIFDGPTKSEKLDGAGLYMTCFEGSLGIAEDLIVRGASNIAYDPVRAGDTIRASVTVGTGGTKVELRNLTPTRTFDLKLAGTDTGADREILGVDSLFSSNIELPIPSFTPIPFTSSKVGGSALNTFGTLDQLVIASGCKVVAAPSGLDSTGTKFGVQIPTGLRITSLSPESGLTGAVVTVGGADFNSSSTVSFNGVASTSVTYMSATKLKATVPPSAAGGPVTVRNTTAPTGTVTSVCPFLVEPSITSFAPTSGITGTSVTLNGSGFVGTQNVAFGGGKLAKFKFVSPSQLDVTVPNGAVTDPISTTNASGSTSSAAFYTVTLSITNFSPTSGPAGTVVTINGVGFSSTAGVTFGGDAAASIIHVSAHRLRATVPSGAVTAQIRVSNTSGTVGTVYSPGRFKVT